MAQRASCCRSSREEELAQDPASTDHGRRRRRATRATASRASPRRSRSASKLFFEPRLSGTGSVLCATCHVPFRAFQDARARAFGLQEVDRNTPSLLDVSLYRWYGWDGAHDSLWAQSIRPLLDEREMRAPRRKVAQVDAARCSPGLRRPLRPQAAGGRRRGAGRRRQGARCVPGDAGHRAHALRRFSRRAARRARRCGLSGAAQRGLQIFVGKGNCSTCHFGPQFTNGEFADTGVPFFVGPGASIPGGHGGIEKLQASPFNLLGRYNDDAAERTAVRHAARRARSTATSASSRCRPAQRRAHRAVHARRQPRDAARGGAALLGAERGRLHADGERILKPLKLTQAESDDLVAFLESLTALTCREARSSTAASSPRPQYVAQAARPTRGVAQHAAHKKRASHAARGRPASIRLEAPRRPAGARRATAAGTAELNTSSPKLNTTVPTIQRRAGALDSPA